MINLRRTREILKPKLEKAKLIKKLNAKLKKVILTKDKKLKEEWEAELASFNKIYQ